MSRSSLPRPVLALTLVIASLVSAVFTTGLAMAWDADTPAIGAISPD